MHTWERYIYETMPFGISQGNNPDVSLGHKFGRNANVGTSFVPVAAGGNYRTPQVGNAVLLRVAGGDAADSPTGAGARSVTLSGLDNTGAAISETIATGGTSPGPYSTKSFLRLFRVVVEQSGSYSTQETQPHAADIVIEDNSGTPLEWARILDTEIGRGQSQIGDYTVPLGFDLYLTELEFSTDSSKAANIVFFQRRNILEVGPPYTSQRVFEEYTGISGPTNIRYQFPIGPFPELTDVGFLARVTTGTSDVSVAFNYLLVRRSSIHD